VYWYKRKGEFYSVVVATCPRYTLLHLGGLDALLFPNLNLAVFGDLASSLFIVFDRFGSISVGSYPQGMTPLGPEVEGRGMCDDSVVPESDRVGLPVEAHLEVQVPDLLEQEVQNGIRLNLGNADDATRETWIDVDTLPAGYGVNADDRMDGLDGFATNVEPGSAGTFSLSYSAVEGGKGFQVGLQPRAKGRIKGISVYVGVRQHGSFSLSTVNLP